jgi:hypothetical protein
MRRADRADAAPRHKFEDSMLVYLTSISAHSFFYAPLLIQPRIAGSPVKILGKRHHL